MSPWPPGTRTPVVIMTGRYKGMRGVINGDFANRKRLKITKAFVYLDEFPYCEMLSLSQIILDTQSTMDLSDG